MSSSDNVIDLQKHRAKRQEQADSKAEDFIGRFSSLEPSSEIVDITEVRQEIIDEEKRGVKRTILTEFIALHVVVPTQGLVKCVLYDISEGGLAFELPEHMGAMRGGEKVAMRVYLNHKTYFPFVVRVNHVQPIDDEGVYRHGCSFEKETINETSLFHFAKFIETISTFLKTDHGDVMVSNLSKK